MEWVLQSLRELWGEVNPWREYVVAVQGLSPAVNERFLAEHLRYFQAVNSHEFRGVRMNAEEIVLRRRMWTLRLKLSPVPQPDATIFLVRHPFDAASRLGLTRRARQVATDTPELIAQAATLLQNCVPHSPMVVLLMPPLESIVTIDSEKEKVAATTIKALDVNHLRTGYTTPYNPKLACFEIFDCNVCSDGAAVLMWLSVRL